MGQNEKIVYRRGGTELGGGRKEPGLYCGVEKKNDIDNVGEGERPHINSGNQRGGIKN